MVGLGGARCWWQAKGALEPLSQGKAPQVRRDARRGECARQGIQCKATARGGARSKTSMCCGRKRQGKTRNSNKCELRKTGSNFAQRADTSERTNCNIEPKRLAKKDAHSQRETLPGTVAVRWTSGKRCRPSDVANWPPPSATRQCSSLLLTNGH